MLFILRRLTEKFGAKNKKLLLVFVDLDQVSNEIICFALRWKVVLEYLVDGVMSPYKSC